MDTETTSCKQCQLITMVIINSNIKQQLGPDWLKTTGRFKRP